MRNAGFDQSAGGAAKACPRGAALKILDAQTGLRGGKLSGQYA
jgi:hypothetical protein